MRHNNVIELIVVPPSLSKDTDDVAVGVTYLLLFGFVSRSLVNLGKLSEFDALVLLAIVMGG